MWVCNLWSRQSHLILPNTWCTELPGYLASWVWPIAALLILMCLVLRNVNVLFIIYSGFLWKSCRLMYFFIVRILLTGITSWCTVWESIMSFSTVSSGKEMTFWKIRLGNVGKTLHPKYCRKSKTLSVTLMPWFQTLWNYFMKFTAAVLLQKIMIY